MPWDTLIPVGIALYVLVIVRIHAAHNLRMHVLDTIHAWNVDRINRGLEPRYDYDKCLRPLDQVDWDLTVWTRAQALRRAGVEALR